MAVRCAWCQPCPEHTSRPPDSATGNVILVTAPRSLRELFDQIGLQEVPSTDGTVVMEMPVDERVTNTAGGLQGGLIATMADVTAGQLAARSTPFGHGIATTDLFIRYLRPIKTTGRRGPSPRSCARASGPSSSRSTSTAVTTASSVRRPPSTSRPSAERATMNLSGVGIWSHSCAMATRRSPPMGLNLWKPTSRRPTRLDATEPGRYRKPLAASARSCRVNEHLSAGADHVCVQVLDADPRYPREQWRRLAAALPV